jgi:hypothetical protein
VLQTKSEEEEGLQQPALQKSEEKKQKLKGRSTSSNSKRERTLENSGGWKGGTAQSVSDCQTD